VRSLSGMTTDSLRVAFGKELYAQNCVACHGAEGKGNAALGAPNLADRVWLHGSAEAVVMETISRGRQNQMPAHKALLDEARIHLLTAYVLSLSK
jgi:cytochrome c oxidase cbb3-type subunit 3